MTKKIETTKVPQVKRSHKKKVIPIINGKNTNIADAIRATFRDAGIPVSTTHPATILYKKLPDDMILITGFENFKSIDDILDQYGRVVATVYAAFSYQVSGVQGAIFLTGLAGFGAVRAGQVYSKHEFSKIIAHVKKCGGLLHDIIQAVNGEEVKRIEI